MQVEPFIYNPQKRPVGDLPVVFGFPHTQYGHTDWGGIALSQDGVKLAHHVSSCEGWLAIDLGTSKFGNPSRHAAFREHYPDGFRTEYVGSEKDCQHEGLNAAIAKFKELNGIEDQPTS